jgi:hypothetical protein
MEKFSFDSELNKAKNLKEKNIYGKEKYPPENAKEHLESLINNFKKYYLKLGYIEEPPVLASSGIDPTVRFVGSQISVLKPYIEKDQVPNPGVFMYQDCIRTQNADNLLNDDYNLALASYFPGLGALAHPERLTEACREVFSFLENKLDIPKKNILIHISKVDNDLVNACKEYFGDTNLEFDSKKSEYYRHEFGMEGILGRNFNISLKDSHSNGFLVIGNVIIIEKSGKQLGIEIALGSTIILKQMFGLDHTLDCTPVVELESLDAPLRRKFEDAIVTSIALYREGLRPFGSHNRNRILKQYIRSLSYFRAKSSMDFQKLTRAISNFEVKQYTTTGARSTDILIEFLKSYENELKYKKNLTEDEKKINKALKLLDKM